MGSIQGSDVGSRARPGVRCRLGIFCRSPSTESQLLQTSAEQRIDVFDLFNNGEQIAMPRRPQRHRRPRLDHHARAVVDGRDVNRMDNDTAFRSSRLIAPSEPTKIRRAHGICSKHPELKAQLAHCDLKTWMDFAHNGQSSK
jgi:hypothetical protein